MTDVSDDARTALIENWRWDRRSSLWIHIREAAPGTSKFLWFVWDANKHHIIGCVADGQTYTAYHTAIRGAERFIKAYTEDEKRVIHS